MAVLPNIRTQKLVIAKFPVGQLLNHLPGSLLARQLIPTTEEAYERAMVLA